MENSAKSPTVVGPQDGQSLSVVGDTYKILVSGDDFAAIDMLIPPGGGPGPHAHAEIQESFFVIDGEIEVRSEAGVYTAVKGACVTIPKGGIVHCFKNKSDRVAHLLCMVTPGGLDKFFMEIGKPVENGEFLPPPVMDEEAMKKLLPVFEKYGQKVFPPDFLDKV